MKDSRTPAKGAPDFYAKISIGSQTFTTPRAPDDRTKVFVPEGWTMTQQVSTSLPSVDISVQIWDADVFPDLNGDDLADSTPRPDDATSRFKLDLVDGSLSGDLTSSNQCLLGNGEEDQPPVQVCFDVRPYSFEDGDGDGFTDYAEHRGLDFNGDGSIDLHLEQFADPTRRDLFVEIDWMKDEGPGRADLDAVEGAFDAARVENPITEARGLALHLIPDEELTWAETLRFDGRDAGAYDDFDDLKWGDPAKSCTHGGEDGHFGTPADRASPLCEQILLFKRLHFRYGIFIHGLSPATVTGRDGKQHPNTTSGMAELDDRGGNDFVVSVGRFARNIDVSRYNGIGAVRQATLLHELGHTFGLGHGGRTDDEQARPGQLQAQLLQHHELLAPVRHRQEPARRPAARSRPAARPPARRRQAGNAGGEQPERDEGSRRGRRGQPPGHLGRRHRQPVVPRPGRRADQLAGRLQAGKLGERQRQPHPRLRRLP